MTVNVNLIVVCGFADCSWSMKVDPDAGADPMAVQQAYLEHLDVHDPAEDPDCETADRFIDTTHAALDECPSCHAGAGHPHTEYCKLPQWAAHDAEVARALAEDKIPGARGGFYNGQLYPPFEQPVFNCPKCQAISYHPEDVRQGYCGRCHEFTGLYAGDNPSKLAAEQARIDRFMAGGADR